jgi:hypothetical protein
VNDRTNQILASIDGALADTDLPDAMRWSPTPHEAKSSPLVFDGESAWQPPQRYEQAGSVTDVTRPPRLSGGCVTLHHTDCDDPARCLCSCHDRPRLPLPGENHLHAVFTVSPEATARLMESIGQVVSDFAGSATADPQCSDPSGPPAPGGTDERRADMHIHRAPP